MLARLRRSFGGRGRRAMFAALIGLVVVSGISAVALLRARQASAAVTPANATLLMVHGFNDDCYSAFKNTQNPGISAGAYPSTTRDFFAARGWISAYKLVGYYTDDSHSYIDDNHQGEAPCDANLNTSTGDFSGNQCARYLQVATAPDPYVRVNTAGTASDPIRHLGCLMAWYIRHLNVDSGVPVVILAHSMGGLIVRDAIGESGQAVPGFPSVPLNIARVVTVATPHGGQRGAYLTLAQWYFHNANVPREVWDMDPSSPFMSMLISEYQSPRGANQTLWTLIAGSVPGGLALSSLGRVCVPADPTGTVAVSCYAEYEDENGHYPDGDGVVQADSALSMQADTKILYGSVSGCTFVLACNETYTPTPYTSVNYSHEANNCQTLLQDPPKTACLTAEFLLNDATSQPTGAWVCSSACNAGASGTGGIADLHVDDSSNPNVQSIPHSLEEMFSFLPPPPPPTPTPTTVPTCTTWDETDDIQMASTSDLRDNNWRIYYDIKRDKVNHAPCQMRVVVRIYSPAPAGVWNGAVGVWAFKNGTYIDASWSKHSGSGTYANHLVWRGPWFSATSATYIIKSVEYNGSNYYTRAWGTFTI